MNIKYFWKKELPPSVMEVGLHPSNQALPAQLEKFLQQPLEVTAIDPRNERKVLLPLEQIESIESFAHLSRLTMEDGRSYHLQKTLKELSSWEAHRFWRINNSTILNFAHVASFAAGGHARLEVLTKQQRLFVVSRHYAKQIKQLLLAN